MRIAVALGLVILAGALALIVDLTADFEVVYEPWQIVLLVIALVAFLSGVFLAVLDALDDRRQTRAQLSRLDAMIREREEEGEDS